MRFPAVDRQFPHLDCAADSAAGLALMRAIAKTAFVGKHVDFRKHPLQSVLRRPHSQLAHSHRIDRKRAVRKRKQFTLYVPCLDRRFATRSSPERPDRAVS